MRVIVVVGLMVGLAGCSSADPGSLGSGAGSSNGSGSTAGSGSGSGTTAGSTDDAALQHCVDVINSYRAKVGGAPYARSAALEAFAATGAQSDSETGQAHGHFIATSGGKGVAFAENELPGWPAKQYGGITGVIDQGMQAMWDEGPGGGHYDNMTSTKYTQAGCGTFTTPTGDVWVTTDFK